MAKLRIAALLSVSALCSAAQPPPHESADRAPCPGCVDDNRDRTVVSVTASSEEDAVGKASDIAKFNPSLWGRAGSGRPAVHGRGPGEWEVHLVRRTVRGHGEAASGGLAVTVESDLVFAERAVRVGPAP